MPFTPDGGVPCELLPDGRLRVTAPVVWTGTRGDAVLIPAGTITDLASVPRVARGLVDVGGPIGRAAIVHDVLCDAANAWSRAGCPEESRPRFLGPDIDGALRAAARDLGAGNGRRWLYWVAVRWAALFGSRGRRTRWLSTVLPVLALSLPALAVAVAPVLGALIGGALLLLVDALAWPDSDHGKPMPRALARRAALQAAPADPPRQLSAAAVRLALAARRVEAAAQSLAGPQEAGHRTWIETGAWPALSAPPPVGPTSGPQSVVRARRAAARQRNREPAPWCATYLQPCPTGCDPSHRCERAGDPADWLVTSDPCPRCGSYRCGCRPLPPAPYAAPHVVPHEVCGCGWQVDPASPVAPYDQAREHERNPNR